MEYVTPAEFEDRLRELLKRCKNSYGEVDKEMFHIYADELICKVLSQHGYEAGVKIFENTEKWYA